jgi:hypothetical protein
MEIQCLRLEPADNGFKVKWTECTKEDNSGTFGNASYKDHELVFKDEESNEAMEKFMEMRDASMGTESSKTY